MKHAKHVLLAAVAATGLFLLGPTAKAADDKAKGATGILIDNSCGAKQKNEASAAKHPVACSLKDACAASGYQLIVGDKHYKLDDKGNEQAKAYLATADSNRVTIEGKMAGTKIEVSSIKAAEKMDEK